MLITSPPVVELTVDFYLLAYVEDAILSPDSDILSFIGLFAFIEEADQDLAVIADEKTATMWTIYRS